MLTRTLKTYNHSILELVSIQQMFGTTNQQQRLRLVRVSLYRLQLHLQVRLEPMLTYHRTMPFATL
jgi:hypothetical protein